jgi:uncharacterized repeat protein (TIGR02543 family)
MNRRKLCPGAAASLLLLFLACEMMGPEPKTAPGVDGKALVRIGIEAEGSLGRTVLPAVVLGDVSRWKLEGEKSGGTKTQLGDFSESDRETFYFYLEPGTWDFTLTGYDDNAPILRGSLTGQTITLEGPNNLSFTAAPILDSGATGTFKITINLSPGHGITTVKVLRDGTELETPLTPVDDKVIFEDTSLAAQNYYFSFLLYKDGDLYGVVSEAVQVRANLRSEGSRELALTDLNRTFTITYHLDGGSGVTSPGYYHTDAVRDLPEPAKTGYIFGGWYENAECSGVEVTTIPQDSEGDKVFYAKWILNSAGIITLKLDTGDKTFEQESFTVSKSGGLGSQALSLPGTDYTNLRWFVDGDLKETGTDITITAADYGVGEHTLTLLANKSGVSWSKEITFTVEAGTLRRVIFRSNDGTGAIYAIKTLTAGTNLVGNFPADPDRTGYDFKGWNIQADGLGTAFTDTTTVSADTTVYAKWSGEEYTVHFMSNYDDTELYTKTVTVPVETIADFPDPPPTRTGWNFAGWNTEPDGSGTTFGQTTVVAGNLTVYAQWAHDEFNITLELDAGNGALTPETAFTLSQNGETQTQSLTLAGTGYTNPRWFVDGDLKGTGTNIEIIAAEYGKGKHYLTLLVTRNGVSWSKEITFTVIEL